MSVTTQQVSAPVISKLETSQWRTPCIMMFLFLATLSLYKQDRRSHRRLDEEKEAERQEQLPLLLLLLLPVLQLLLYYYYCCYYSYLSTRCRPRKIRILFTTTVTKIPIKTTTTTTTVAAKTSPNKNNLLPEAAAITLISVNKEMRAAAARDVNNDHQLQSQAILCPCRSCHPFDSW